MNECKIIICFQPPPASVSSGASEGKYDPRGTSDDVVVTKEGCRVLTDAVPKTIPEIEALMAD